MSFRVYPKYIKGNPRLRVFLPNFWLKLVKPKTPVPPNVAHFIVPLEMSDFDVRNYLEKIYQIPVVEVRTKVYSGELKRTHKNYLIKEDDYRMAFVTVGQGQSFTFPDLFPKDKVEKETEDRKRILAQTSEVLENQKDRNWKRADVPSWFGI